MLCLARSGCHRRLLRPKQGIDRGGFAHVGVASQANCHSPMVSLQTNCNCKCSETVCIIGVCGQSKVTAVKQVLCNDRS